MKSLSDIVDHIPKPVRVRTSERSELIRFFHENLFDKSGKPYTAQRIAIKLAHLSIDDLYYLKSVFSDVLRRSGQTAAQKYFWWSLKSVPNI